MATASKAALREQLLAARNGVADAVRASEAGMLNEHLEPAVSSGSTVCAYVPVGTEPGSVQLLDMLLRRAGGCCCRLRARPVTALRCRCGGANTGQANSSAVGGDCSSRPSPGCPSRPLPRPAWWWSRRWQSTVGGSGWAEAAASTTLTGRPRPSARLIAMVRDDELIDELPAEPHDVAMTHVVTRGMG